MNKLIYKFKRILFYEILSYSTRSIIKRFVINLKWIYHKILTYFKKNNVNPIVFKFLDEYKIIYQNNYSDIITHPSNNYIRNDEIARNFNDFVLDVSSIDKTETIYQIDNLIAYKNKWLLKDNYATIIDNRVRNWPLIRKEYNLKQIIFDLDYSLFDSTSRITIDEAIVITDSLTNYYHWHFETILKLIRFSSLMPEVKNVVMLEPSKKYQQEMISIFSKNFNFYFINKTTSFILNKGYILEHSLNSPETAYKENLIYLKDFLDVEIKENTFEKKRIFITRESKFRNLINKNEFYKYLNNNRIEIIDFAKISLLDQIKIIKSADLIILLHGASLINLIYANKIKIIEIMHKNRLSRETYLLAINLKLDYYYFIDENDSNSHDPDIKIDIEKFNYYFLSLF